MSRNVPETLPGLSTGDEQARSPDGASGAGGRPRIRKSAEAYRTISEVADDLHVPQHVLRFWETKFPRIRPLKRGGGRRYYRPDDVALLRRIADLLYIQGYTIKGVQRLLKEGGGALHDDIPPATGDDRASSPEDASEASGRTDAGQAGDDGLFGAGSSASDEARTPEPASAQSRSHKADANQPETPRQAEQAAEIKRLRSILMVMLVELEALRRKLG